ncbi:MAG: tRNA (guanosine(37)-N1)-methyltransferase TrmD [Actinomycetia bacterium]|nr:tRNA (guanosine(37)-N1)-methyltransferase TrmD [Actinomycetes bacterium]MCP4959087.1 tRNA (guanosine(37)-N1)-methyltransferase TrmD [Actinomycetes bacterium]
MRIDVFTIFPQMIDEFVVHGVIGKGVEAGVIDVRSHDLRMATTNRHRTVDDAPFGGGAGMVLMPEPVFAAVEQVCPPRPLLALTPGGRPFDHDMAVELAGSGEFSLLCGRYEGIDQRIIDNLCDGEVSIGDVVLAGGEVAAMLMIEAVGRLVPGVLGNESSPLDESFASGLIEYPQFTRPARFRHWEVPDVLRSGDHARVDRWRRASALARTIERRPDLIEARGELSNEDHKLLAEFGFS